MALQSPSSRSVTCPRGLCAWCSSSCSSHRAGRAAAACIPARQALSDHPEALPCPPLFSGAFLQTQPVSSAAPRLLHRPRGECLGDSVEVVPGGTQRLSGGAMRATGSSLPSLDAISSTSAMSALRLAAALSPSSDRLGSCQILLHSLVLQLLLPHAQLARGLSWASFTPSSSAPASLTASSSSSHAGFSPHTAPLTRHGARYLLFQCCPSTTYQPLHQLCTPSLSTQTPSLPKSPVGEGLRQDPAVSR